MPRTRAAISCRRPGGWCAIAPPAGDGVRVDTGVYEGGEISIYYDPMIAKLIGHRRDARGGDRAHARGARRVSSSAASSHNIAVPRRLHRQAALPRRRALDRLHRRGISRAASPAPTLDAGRRGAGRRRRRRGAASSPSTSADRRPARRPRAHRPSAGSCATATRVIPCARSATATAIVVAGDGEPRAVATDWRPWRAAAPTPPSTASPRIYPDRARRHRPGVWRTAARRSSSRCCRRARPSCWR